MIQSTISHGSESLRQADIRNPLRYLIRLNLNFHPFSLFESDRRKDKPRHLIRQHTEPDSDDAKPQRVTAQIRNDRTNKCNADHGCNCRIERISRTAQASHVNNLTDLENDDEDNDMDDADTDFNDMLFFEKQAVQPSSAEKINGNEAYCDARADQTARSAVLLRKIRLFLRQGSG